MALALALLIISVILIRQGWLKGRRFWLLLALLSAGMFGIGFFRGDYAVMIAGLRADQVLDVMLFSVGCRFDGLSDQRRKRKFSDQENRQGAKEPI